MKKLKFLTPLLIILMVLPACEKENTFEDQVTLNEQIILDDQVAEARNPHPRPFHASFISTEDFFGESDLCGTPPSNILLTQTLTGNATHMGNISGSTSFCIIVGTGGGTFVAANGDELYFVVGPCEDGGTIYFDGGTGRFEDATGCVTSEFELLETDPLLVFSNEMDGEIQY